MMELRTNHNSSSRRYARFVPISQSHSIESSFDCFESSNRAKPRQSRGPWIIRIIKTTRFEFSNSKLLAQNAISNLIDSNKKVRVYGLVYKISDLPGVARGYGGRIIWLVHYLYHFSFNLFYNNSHSHRR